MSFLLRLEYKVGFKVIFDAVKTILWEQPVNFLRSLVIGFIIGVFLLLVVQHLVLSPMGLPNLLKAPDKFGTGIPDGIIASKGE